MIQAEPKEFTYTDLQLARYALAFDLKGSIGMYRTHSKGPNARRYCITLRVEMIRPEILERMSAHFAAGTLKRYTRPRKHPYWRWFCGKSEEVARILRQLKPYLELRAHEATLALEYLEKPLTTAQQDRLFVAMHRPKLRQRAA